MVFRSVSPQLTIPRRSNTVPEGDALEVVGGVYDPEGGLVVALLEEDGGGHEQQRRVRHVHVAGHLGLQLGDQGVAAIHVLGKKIWNMQYFKLIGKF